MGLEHLDPWTYYGTYRRTTVLVACCSTSLSGGLRLPFIHMGSYTEKNGSTSPKIIGKLPINTWTWGSHQVQHGLELAICRFIQCIYHHYHLPSFSLQLAVGNSLHMADGSFNGKTIYNNYHV
jgi:hypothetical protein